MSRATGVKSRLSRYEGAWEAINRLIRSGGSWSGFERNCFFSGTGQAGFINQSAVSGLDYQEDGRGLAVWDYDRDGDPDLLVKNRNAPQVRILRNDSPPVSHRLKVRLEGVRSNRQGIGARVTVRHGGKSRVKELRAGSGFLSQNSQELFFGLGGSLKVDSLEVYWPSGLRQTFRDVPADREVLLREGAKEPGLQPFKKLSKPGPAVAGRPTFSPSPDEPRKVWLLDPVTLPGMNLRDLSGRALSLAKFRGAPLVLNLWTAECSSCVLELSEWKKQRAATGSELAVVMVASAADRESDKTAEIIRRAGFPAVFAEPEDLLAISVLVEEVVRWPRGLRLPCTLLLNSAGLLARIYEGRTGWAGLSADAAGIPGDPRGRLDKGLPFPGGYYSSDWFRNEFQLGVSYLEAGLPARGLEAFERTLIRRPGEVEALYNIGLIQLQAGKLDSAREAFELALEGQPEFIDSAANLGVVLARQGRLEDSYRVFSKVLESRPGHIEALINIGNIELTVGAPERARKRFEEVIRLEPGLVAGYKRLGAVCRSTGDLDGAREVYEKAAAIDPEDPELWSNLGVILAEGGRFKEARKMCERSVRVSPGYASGHNNLGLVLQALGEADGAVGAFRKSISLAPEGPSAYLNLARLYIKLGRKAESGSLLRRYLELQPGHQGALKLLKQLGE
ncbi:MAG: tetratricopeptide repeat protein [Planctomycetota bacterium]|nr:tetratricopeptide repeat protein [Planctomycetota bacterium]